MPHRSPAGGSGRLPHPYGPPSNSLQRSAHHDLDVTVVAPIVLGGDIAEPGIVLPGLTARCHIGCACQPPVPARAVAAMGLRDRLGHPGSGLSVRLPAKLTLASVMVLPSGTVWAGGLPCPWAPGTVDTVACRESTGAG